MKALRSLIVSILVVSVVALAVGVLYGCGTKEEAEPQATTEQEEAAQPQTEQEEVATEAAEAEVAYDNPKPGICPVCKMKVEKGYIEVAKIEDKNYACCSARCVTMLTEKPAEYLTEEPEESGHEGHGH